MSAHNVLIISGEPAVSRGLLAAFAQAAVARDIRVLEQLPSREELNALLGADGRKITAALIDVGMGPRAFGLIEELSAARGGLRLIPVAAEPSTETLNHLAGLGVSELLTPPFNSALLARILSQDESAGSAGGRGRVIAVASAQGGDGASVIGLELVRLTAAESTARTLLVDLDLEASLVNFRLRLEPKFTWLDGLERARQADELWEKLVCRSGNVDVLPAPRLEAVSVDQTFSDLPQLLGVARRRYSLTLLDLPARFDARFRKVLPAADEIYLVCTPRVASMHLARRRLEELLAWGVARERVRLAANRLGCLNGVRTSQIEDAVGFPVSWSIRQDEEAMHAAAINDREVAPESAVGRELHALAQKVCGIQSARPPQARGWRKVLKFG